MTFTIKDSRRALPIYKIAKKKMAFFVGYFGGKYEDIARNLSVENMLHWEYINDEGQSVTGEGWPARPFLTDFFDEGYADQLKPYYDEFWRNFIATGRPDPDKLGTKIVQFIRNFVESNPYAETSPNQVHPGKGSVVSVQDDKGFNHPLIRTGQMLEELEFKFIVEDKEIG